MPSIGANPDAMRSRSSEIRGDAGELEQLTSKLTGRVNDLAADWQGQAAQAFNVQWMDEIRPVFDRTRQTLEDLSVQLSQAASIIEENDANMANQIRR